MKKLITLLLVLLVVFYSCGEKLIDKPENLIPKDEMVLILKDMAILNAAKSTNMGILKDHEIEPTAYIFEKYKIDSIQFVESDRYYASLPVEYESIYTQVESLLDEQKTLMEEKKKIKDSLELVEKKNNLPKNDSLKSSSNLKKDTRQ
ncbi:DUF4296 domain-containing protein [Maribacter thermophilus]|uniref:DUF4296 domain-containing protein n=1 Tax=Maribacter thermophilus TaxID=1197874 RepID=UPI000640FEA6|nr:DUF4296 domain-containing protein [Maribacter thermophilus]